MIRSPLNAAACRKDEALSHADDIGGSQLQTIRAQLILPEQQDLFDYWRSKSGDGSDGHCPRRIDIRPGEMRALLPSISLYDVIESEPLRLRVRLAGTRLRDYLGRETTGLMLDELEQGDTRAYWDVAYREVIRSRRPAQGVIEVGRPGRAELFRFWLRLPLEDDEGRIHMVLGHDIFLQSEKAHAIASRASLQIA